MKFIIKSVLAFFKFQRIAKMCIEIKNTSQQLRSVMGKENVFLVCVVCFCKNNQRP